MSDIIASKLAKKVHESYSTDLGAHAKDCPGCKERIEKVYELIAEEYKPLREQLEKGIRMHPPHKYSSECGYCDWVAQAKEILNGR